MFQRPGSVAHGPQHQAAFLRTVQYSTSHTRYSYKNTTHARILEATVKPCHAMSCQALILQLELQEARMRRHDLGAPRDRVPPDVVHVVARPPPVLAVLVQRPRDPPLPPHGQPARLPQHERPDRQERERGRAPLAQEIHVRALECGGPREHNASVHGLVGDQHFLHGQIQRIVRQAQGLARFVRKVSLPLCRPRSSHIQAAHRVPDHPRPLHELPARLVEFLFRGGFGDDAAVERQQVVELGRLVVMPREEVDVRDGRDGALADNVPDLAVNFAGAADELEVCDELGESVLGLGFS